MQNYVIPQNELGENYGSKHVVNRLYGADFDFNVVKCRPSRTYMLATLPRSGSTFCAIRMWQTGVLGAPMEYLNFPVLKSTFRRLRLSVGADGLIDASQVDTYWRKISILRTSPNGVFGYKMFGSNFVEIAKRFPAFLKQISPQHVIYLTRRDVVGQAISYSKSQRSNVWFADVLNAPEVDYDFCHIALCKRQIERQKSAWERYFSHVNLVPIRIYYEDLLPDGGSRVIQHVIHSLGLDIRHSVDLRIPMIRRQSDGRSLEWRERFARDELRYGSHVKGG